MLEDINGEIRQLGFGRHKLSLASTSTGGLSEILRSNRLQRLCAGGITDGAMAGKRSYILRALLILGCAGALAIPAAAASAAPAKARSCGRGEVQEYPYFAVRAHGTSCAVAQHLIRRFLCTNARGHCAAGSHWHTDGSIYVGHWASPAGWHCQARIPPALYEDGKPFGSELCRRGSASVSSKSYG